MIDYNELLIKQRNFFASGKTKEYRYRLNALKALREAMEFYENEINTALKADLNKAPLETYLSEYGVTLQHITHATQCLKKWMRPKRRVTGVNGLPGISYDLYDPYGIVLIMSPWNYRFNSRWVRL